MSLNRSSMKSNMSGQVSQFNREWEIQEQQQQTPLEHQEWFAGSIDLKTATERIRNLGDGTFLVRRINSPNKEEFALDLKTKSGVKHMKIFVEWDDRRQVKLFSFSHARKFSSLVQLISYYRCNDLLENFGYKEMEGMKLIIPYKSV